MPILWTCADDQIWSALTLSHQPIEIGGPFPKERPVDELVNTRIEDVLLCPVGDDRPAKNWVLLWGGARDVRVNGSRECPTGLRIIADRDEIKVDARPAIYFSAETLPFVETFQGGDHEIFCPRCKKTVEPGSPIVRCVECGLIYHYNTEGKLNCYEYSETCLCSHPTRLDAGFRWVPDETCG